jgi:hypothetical protein
MMPWMCNDCEIIIKKEKFGINGPTPSMSKEKTVSEVLPGPLVTFGIIIGQCQML